MRRRPPRSTHCISSAASDVYKRQSLVCVTFVSALFSVVPFLVSQPMANTLSAAIRANAGKHFISISFQQTIRVASLPAGTVPAGTVKNRAIFVPVLSVPHQKPMGTCPRSTSTSTTTATSPNPPLGPQPQLRLQPQVGKPPKSNTINRISKSKPILGIPFDTLRPSDNYEQPVPSRTKKADVAEHPQAFDHVGLLTNEPPGNAGLFFIQSSDFSAVIIRHRVGKASRFLIRIPLCCIYRLPCTLR
eukprot:TRINITY_DN12419_c0_g1_i1.p1 TRINITY_DN12419_c0_g1~~TRINITY_DN12419_c0_g1_i1.p1  ORF type:complete len:246 (-),score=-16.06 TRINITY_DN12419_c0_g1_i1:5-742(-)